MKARLAGIWQQLRAPRAPRVDFQRPAPTHRALVAALWLMASLLLVSTWHHWQRMVHQQQQTDVLEQQFIQLTRRQEQLIQAAIRLSPQQRQQLASFAQQKVTPFALMDGVAQAWSKEIALTRVEVNTQAQLLHLDLEVKQLGDAFRFVDRLKAQPGVQVNLQQSALKNNDPQHPVQVKLTVGAG
ncbi:MULTISPECIES: hypothetical protein [Pseudomonas]|uniref:hypothetical protein n=1 Tax=Pseudomonas TaxID=286 RepID=UPI001BCE60A2|nr:MULTISPECIES: hypothetical protein [Pseudomonas]QVN01255.1 hypothetical protein JYG38_24200 [Pseudomonas rhodesiae]WLG39119.1 hypothetical protein PSH93_24660 [Pseudomonas rhodesiae]